LILRPPSTSVYYQFGVTIGHSYSVKVVQDYDDVDADITVGLFSENTCTTAVASLTDTHGAEPTLAVNGYRQSFTAAATGSDYIKVINSNGATGRYIAVSVSDTTDYNVRWSTYAGFITQWGFQNTTSQAINVKMVATVALGGSGTGNMTFSVPANSETYKVIAASGGDINIGPNVAGYAVASNDGPPGGLLVDAYFINPSATVIVPSVFQPVRSLQH